MINTIINSFKINNAYYANTLVYRLRHLPLIGKKIPTSLYGNNAINILANIIVSLYKIISPFIGKFIYVFLMIYLPYTCFSNSNAFINIFVFLTIIGAFCNTDMFNPTKNKYYSIVLMRMNAKKFALSSLLAFLFTLFISFYPAVIVLGLLAKVDLFILLFIPIFIVCMKIIGNALLLQYYDKTKRVLTENNFFLVGTISIIGLLLAYGLPFLNYAINNIIFIILLFVSVLSSFIALKYIINNNNYNKIYRSMLNINTIIFNATDTSTTNLKNQYSSKIESKEIVTSNKHGYEYFNDIFTKRHKSILTKSAIKMALIAIVILLIAIGVAIYSKEASLEINNFMLKSLPYFVFVMYFLNRGSVITQAMFINCDHSMLAYRFYRKPKVILNLFKERMKTLIKINMIPAIVIALGLPLLLYITGGTNNIYNYILLFISIIFLSIFFSVHHLVIYYLLQPYDINMKSKSSMYSIINGATYFICYMCIDLVVPTNIFATLITVVSIIYILIALFLVYKYASKTFKLK